MQVKFVAQGLLQTWKKDEKLRLENEPNSIGTPLMYYLEFNYKERYVKLCYRLGLTPQSFGKWLCKPIESIV